MVRREGRGLGQCQTRGRATQVASKTNQVLGHSYMKNNNSFQTQSDALFASGRIDRAKKCRRTTTLRRVIAKRLYARHDPLRGFDGEVDVLFGVLKTGEAGFVLRGGEVHALFKHAAVPPGELVGVGFGGVREVAHGAFAEKQAEHASDGAAAHGVAVVLARLQNSRD